LTVTTTTAADIPAILDALTERHDAAVGDLRRAIAAYLAGGASPDPAARAAGLFAYPELRVDYEAEGAIPRFTRAFARLNQSGSYATSITRPRLFRRYLEDQLGLLVRDYKVRISVGRSRQEIPYSYVLDGADELSLDGVQAAELARVFPSVRLSDIGDEIADGLFAFSPDPGQVPTRPLSLFEGPRVDFSLARLKHYSGTPAEDFRPYILFTNYIRYVDEFVAWALGELKRPDSPYEALSVAGGVLVTRETADPERAIADGNWRKVQMPPII